MPFLQVCFCSLVLYTLISGSLSTKSLNNTIANNNTSTLNVDKNSIPIITEGETILFPKLPKKENNTNFYLGREGDKGEAKSIVARKGVVYNQTDNDTDFTNSSVIENVSTVSNLSQIITPKIAILNNTVKVNDTLQSNKTKHKPLVLSYEALAQSDEKNNVNFDTNEASIKVHAMSSNSHPGMILPIVITILVVPMFAVVGYMALKRGKEAWKNRHYKRMDFLLDGMYND